MRKIAMVLLVFALVGPILGFGAVGCGTGLDFTSPLTLPGVNVTTPGGSIQFQPSPVVIGSPRASVSPFGETPVPIPIPSPQGSPSPSPSPF